MGVINEFFKKLGIEKLRFKPAYNPYTEPSMEIFSYHDGKLYFHRTQYWDNQLSSKYRSLRARTCSLHII